MPKVDVNGLQMYYEFEAAGTPVVMISALSGDHLAWGMQVPALTAAGYRPLVFDSRDAGQTSESPVPSYTIRHFADDTVRLMQALDVPSAHFVGASMGGMIAQEIALHHPERVSSLTLVCTVPATDEPVGAVIRAFKAARPLCTADEFFRTISPWLLTYRFYQQPEPLETFAQMARNNPFPQSPEQFARQCDAILSFDAAGRLGNITAPTHVVVGSEDTLTPPRYSRELASRIPGARLTEIPNCGHGLFWEATEEFNRAVIAFLDAQSRARAATARL